MFYCNQENVDKSKYELLLRIVGSLSKLSSDNSSIPYLYYRIAENIFCSAFKAKNLSRSDISIDASKGLYGIGLKTFLHKNGNCMEKIAEFNRDRSLYSNFTHDTGLLIKTVSELRNKRILSTCGICSLLQENMIYHCVTRDNLKFYLHEEPMKLIDIDTIEILKVKDNIVSFKDKYEEYSFNLSKSTLFKRFNITPIYEINVTIFDKPFDLLEKYLAGEFELDVSNKIIDTIYLPLYSYRKGSKELYVPERSGLNQWNAGGRKRSSNEVYIPFPAFIRHHKPDFFPSRDISFTLNLPNGEFKMAKICQDNDKALMTNPNDDLGKWLLRDVLSLPEGEVVTYKKLQEIGIDTVQINKFEDNTYEINFKRIGTFENYRIEENIID